MGGLSSQRMKNKHNRFIENREIKIYLRRRLMGTIS